MAIPATTEVREHYIDPTLRTINGWPLYYTNDANVRIYDYREWDNTISIRLNAEGNYDIVYYKQDGTKVEYTLVPTTKEHYCTWISIQADGSYVAGENNGFG